MLFADEPFWKPPNVFDALSVVAFVVGVGSVWLSWWLAKRDISRRLSEAAAQAAEVARREVQRVAATILQSRIADVIRTLELVREANTGRQWLRARELCQQAREQIAKVVAQPGLDVEARTELDCASSALRDCVSKLRSQPRAGTGQVPSDVEQVLHELLVRLNRVEAALTAVRPEVADG